MRNLRKWMSLLLACVLCVGMAACGSGGGSGDAEKVAQDYLNALKNGESEKVSALESSDADSLVDEISESGLEELSGLGVSDENVEAFEVALWRYIGSAFQSWTIKSSEENGDEAKVYAEITGTDLDQIGDSTELANTMSETVTEWLQNHLSDMESYSADHTEEEQAAWLVNEIMPLLCTALESSAKDLPQATAMYRISLVKENGSWKVQNMEVEDND